MVYDQTETLIELLTLDSIVLLIFPQASEE